MRMTSPPMSPATLTPSRPHSRVLLPPAALFAPFGPAVKTRWDENFLYIESNGLPAHSMMIGITAWQQQVPLPQDYTGSNAWRIPLNPVPAKEPATIHGRFLRGAIAIAANGIPIFNPQNNRGEISLDIGELDQWGGHCGRADDYHYHIAPLHLQNTLGPYLPIAYALDGYPIYGLAEPTATRRPDLMPCGDTARPHSATTTMPRISIRSSSAAFTERSWNARAKSTRSPALSRSANPCKPSGVPRSPVLKNKATQASKSPMPSMAKPVE